MIDFPSFLRQPDNFEGEYLKEGTQLLFHHIPKTAGSTMRGILESMVKKDQVCPAETVQELDSIPTEEINKYRIFAGHFSYGVINKVLPDAIWITFLREPNERVISQYHNHINDDRIPEDWQRRVDNNPEWKNYKKEIEGCTLEEWITHPNKWANSITCNRQVQAFIPQKIRVEINDWSNYDSELLNIAKRNLETRFAFVGIQEYFDLSFALFSSVFGLQPLTGFDSFTTNLNLNKQMGKRYNVDERVSQLLTERNQMDWDLYNYGVDLFLSRVNKMMCGLIKGDRATRLKNWLPETPYTEKNEWCIDEVLDVTGFYALESGHGGRVFKWTGADESSVIEIDKKLSCNKSYRIEITAINTISKDILNTVKVMFDNKAILNTQMKKSWIRQNLVITFETRITSAEEERYHVIELMSDYVSEDKDRKDARMLGLAIHSLKVTEV